MKKTDKAKIKKGLELLGLDSIISISEVKTRYKELCKIHHPDLNSEVKNSGKMAAINTAYKQIIEYLENVIINLNNSTLESTMGEDELWQKKFGQDFFFGGNKNE
jgi:preprotein translocase subunit Sec63